MQHSMDYQINRQPRADSCSHPVDATGMRSTGTLYCKRCGTDLDIEDPATRYTERLLLAVASPEGQQLAQAQRQAAEAQRVDALLCAGRC